MARLRTIKPEFWASEQVMELSRDARLAFIGLWNFCDDNGVHPASAKTLKAEIFPADDLSADAVLALVAEMVAQGLVFAYEIDGRGYWQVTGWRHQYIKHPSVKHPLPPNNCCAALPPDDGNAPVALPPATGHDTTGRPPEKELKRKRNRSKPYPPSGKPMGSTSSVTDSVTTAAGEAAFDAWWAQWPRKVAKAEALAAWRKLAPDAELAARMVAAVLVQAASEPWRRDGGMFIPYPATWINGRRWEDELPAGDYSPAQAAVMAAYNAALTVREWPRVVATPYDAARAAAIDGFLRFNDRAGWVADYFAWLAEHLQPLEGYGFDWAITQRTYLRARERNFAALRAPA